MLKQMKREIQKFKTLKYNEISDDENQKHIELKEILDYTSKYHETIQKITDHLQKNFPITSTNTTPTK